MRFSKALVIGGLLFSTLIFSTQGDAATIAGTSCTKVGMKKVVTGVTYICTKKGTSKVWVKQNLVKPSANTPTPTPSATPAPSQTPTAPSFQIAIYTGGAGNPSGTGGVISEEIPSGFTPRVNSDNLKLWIYDPENHSRPLGSPGIWVQKTGGNWYFIPAGAMDGMFTTNLAEGNYVIDVVEPNGDQKKYSRGRYSISVSSSGSLSIAGLSPNSKGYYSVSAVLNSRRAAEIANFKPTSACQLIDQTGSATMSNAFPRAAGRLTNDGKVRALIVPVDFTDLAGNGNPAEIYRQMAEGTRDFYYKESRSKVEFEFTTLKDYVHLNVPVNTFNLGSYNGGDPGAFFKVGLAAADPLVDFSKFDVVYVLPPSSVAFKQIAYGPAFPSAVDTSVFPTNDGNVLNGSVGGADAWQSLEGAQWKWMAHETGHLFGLFDWYTLDNTNPYGPWDLMSNNWSTAAIELNAWNRYISGWLPDNQVSCLTKSDLTSTGKDYVLETIGLDSNRVKSAMVKLSDKLILVMEVRATAGLDRIPLSQSGLLVYTVDVSVPTIKGMAKTYTAPGASSSLVDAPLQPGQTITVEGVKISVTSFSGNDLAVKLSS